MIKLVYGKRTVEKTESNCDIPIPIYLIANRSTDLWCCGRAFQLAAGGSQRPTIIMEVYWQLEIDPAEHPLQGGKQDAHRHGSADRLGHHSRQRLQKIDLGGIGVEAVDQGCDHIIQQRKQDGEHHRKGHHDSDSGQGDLSGQAFSQPAEEQAEQVVIHQIQHDHIDLKAEEEAPQQGEGGGDGKTRPDAVVKAEAQKDHRNDLNARQGRQSHLGGDQQRH